MFFNSLKIIQLLIEYLNLYFQYFVFKKFKRAGELLGRIKQLIQNVSFGTSFQEPFYQCCFLLFQGKDLNFMAYNSFFFNFIYLNLVINFI